MLNKRQFILSNLVPRGLSRLEAAIYVGVGAAVFDEMVADRRMPGPRHINGRRVWDRFRIDEAFDALPADAIKERWRFYFDA